MALIGKLEKIEAGSPEEMEIFKVEVTNGTVAQLKELAEFLNTEGLINTDDENKKLEEVIKIGISWLVRIKENSKKKN